MSGRTTIVLSFEEGIAAAEAQSKYSKNLEQNTRKRKEYDAKRDRVGLGRGTYPSYYAYTYCPPN